MTRSAAQLASITKARRSVNEPLRRARVAEAARTREWTAESRAKLSAACMGRVYGPDVIDRMRAKKCKAVLCVDRGLQFPSQLAAAQALGLNNASISRACRTGCTIAGLRFQFIT